MSTTTTTATTTPETKLMPAICSGWEARAKAIGLPAKGIRRESDREAYMQGALAALYAAELLSDTDVTRVAFLTSVGRLGDYMAEHAAKYAE